MLSRRTVQKGTEGGRVSAVGNQPAVVIPAYCPSELFLDFLEQLKGIGGFSAIIVVDDGSGEKYGNVFQSAEELPGVVVLRHYVNQGKGRALKTAFNYCLANAREKSRMGVITADADGQHTIQDIVNIGRALKEHPESLVLGCRTFDSREIPFRSRFGNKVSKLAYRWLCGVNVSDTQTGLRGIPYSFLEECCRTEGERYEYETNMLLKAREMEMEITEVPIKTIYEDCNAVSHFNPLKDSFKIYAVVLKYSLSSIMSVTIDYLVFYSLYLNSYSVLAATYAARMCSALVNFGINRNVVFKHKGNFAAQLVKYLLLVVLSGTLSGTSISLLKNLFGLPATVTKVVVELVLYFVNFYVQRTFVFAKKGRKMGLGP